MKTYPLIIVILDFKNKNNWIKTSCFHCYLSIDTVVPAFIANLCFNIIFDLSFSNLISYNLEALDFSSLYNNSAIFLVSSCGLTFIVAVAKVILALVSFKVTFIVSCLFEVLFTVTSHTSFSSRTPNVPLQLRSEEHTSELQSRQYLV